MVARHEDAVLVVELAKLGAINGLQQAAQSILAADFEPDAVEVTDPAVFTVLGFFETIGTLVKHDLLNRDLVLDWVWVAGLWQRVGPAAKRARTRTGVAYLYENFESLAVSQR